MNSTSSALLSMTPGAWKGNDGNWSTFLLTVGDTMSFDVLPSIGGSQIWLPDLKRACTENDTAFDCLDSRGITSNTTFESLADWKVLGPYGLKEQPPLFNLFSKENSTFGLSNVQWTNYSDSSGSQSEMRTALGTYGVEDYWLGQFGLNTAPTSFENRNVTVSSPLELLKDAGLIGSLSYGYTAGASYVQTGEGGSLTLGGYDQARIQSNGINVTVAGASQGLQVHMSVLTVSSDVSGLGRSLLPPDGITATIDSSTSQLWLPGEVCAKFAEAFNITWGESTELYLYGQGTRQKLLDNQASLMFTIDVGGNADQSTNIVLPFAALDLRADWPIYEGQQMYFPLRNATSTSGNILGRVFLQEAYVVVDRERNVFTVSPTSHNASNRELVPILPTRVALTTSPKPSKSLTRGQTAGIVLSCVILGVAAFAIAWWFRRRTTHARDCKASEEAPAIDTADKIDPIWEKPELMASESKGGRFLELDFLRSEEADSTQLLEMSGLEPERELMSTEVLEMEGDLVQKEVKKPVDGEDTSKAGGDEAKDEENKKASSVHELAA